MLNCVNGRSCELSSRCATARDASRELRETKRNEQLAANQSLEQVSGERGIRTLEPGLFPINCLAGSRLQPLGHLSAGREILPYRDGRGKRNVPSARRAGDARMLDPLGDLFGALAQL